MLKIYKKFKGTLPNILIKSTEGADLSELFICLIKFDLFLRLNKWLIDQNITS